MNLSLVISTFDSVGGKIETLTTQADGAAATIESGVSRSLGSADLDSAGSDVIDHFAKLLSNLADAAGDMRERVDHTLSELLSVDEINAAAIDDTTSTTGGIR